MFGTSTLSLIASGSKRRQVPVDNFAAFEFSVKIPSIHRERLYFSPPRQICRAGTYDM